MAEILQGSQTRMAASTRAAELVRAAEVAHDTEVRQSANGVRFATFGETGVADLDLDRMLEAVPAAIVTALKANTYYFVPLALREGALREGAELAEMGELKESAEPELPAKSPSQPAMVASAYTDEFSDAAICHRNVELEHGARGVFISTRLMGDRFALSFEFFINVAHAFAEAAGVPQQFADLVWKQAQEGVRGETSVDAWESRNLAQGRAANAAAEVLPSSARRTRGFGGQRAFAAAAVATGQGTRRSACCTWKRLSRTPWRSTCSLWRSTLITASCASASIRCWLQLLWPQGFAWCQSSFRPTLDMSSLSGIAAERRRA